MKFKSNFESGTSSVFFFFGSEVNNHRYISAKHRQIRSQLLMEVKMQM